ncbi:M48 family metallopeptidase [Pseudoluteimonas lycopersici]|uniref:M48 family metallopeptidase n=1 Tax=Pseudoluteimonas lycopersici TaxID=1324796 RepID=A0A516V3S1_9GAMM|nr:M48 family metallopeptidase [Lysobacter lycopersici]QDQ73178.1 M48 family metallopeptidase [Lysobacter lycopersici]
MRQDPFDGQAYGGQQPQRRGIGISPRLLILVLFAGYAAYYWFSNRSTDPYTGETVTIDKNISPEDEKALGLQAYQEILQQEQPVDPNSQISKQVREITQRLIAKIPQVEDALAAEHGMQAPHIEKSFDWDVNVLQSDQVNAFCLPGGKIAVYTGLVPVAQNADAMSIVLGHEISHALLRHGAQRMTQQKLEQVGQMAGAMSGMSQQSMQAVMAVYGYGHSLPYARKQETQADEMGLMLAAAACFNPQEAIPLWERMDSQGGGQAPPEFASDHPSAGTRIQDLQRLMPKAMEYRQKFCGASAQ